MKIAKQIPAYFLALIYLIFGANYFLHFIPMPPMSGNAGNFVGLLYSTGFLAIVKVLEIVLAILLIVPATRALGQLLIAPISVNILLFELVIAQQPGIGIVLVLANVLAIVFSKNKYLPIVES